MLIKPEKSTFYTQEIKYFGHIITPEKIRMDPKKITTIKD